MSHGACFQPPTAPGRARPRGLGILLASTLLVGLAACSRSAPAAAATTITVGGVDYAFSSDTTSVPAGPVHVVFHNQSTANQHELWVYPQTQPRLQEMVRAKEAGQDVEEQDYLQNVAGDAEDVPSGQTESFDATLQPGTYEFACFITSAIDGQERNHYTLGMHTLLTVTAR